MDFNSVDLTMAIDVFLLLLIGIGPKIALVPFLELSAKMDEPTKERVIRKMLRTASITAILLMVFGGLLTRLLHFSTGALAIAGGIILLVISLAMILSRGEGQTQHDADSAGATDPLRLAVFPWPSPTCSILRVSSPSSQSPQKRSRLAYSPWSWSYSPW